MAKLKDLIDTKNGSKTITIQEVKIPVTFNMGTLEYVADAYGKSFSQFEKDLNILMKRKTVQMGNKEIKLVNSLIYGIVRSGGTETTLEELTNSIGFNEIQSVWSDAMDVFNDGYFQQDDVSKLKDNKQKK